jgi:ubiquinone/menaquinone biosynthesis C-methylase UbiE
MSGVLGNLKSRLELIRRETSHIFDENWKVYDNWFDEHPAVFQSEIRAIKKLMPAYGQGLEIGVGTGRFASILPVRFGLDPSWNMLKLARERKIQVVQGVGELLPFKDASFHFVLIVLTICFVSDPRKVLRESARVLKREGVLILGIIDRESHWGRYYEAKAAQSKFYKSARFFSAHDILKLLNDIPGAFSEAYQTLLHPPPELSKIERPKTSYGQGGFVILKWTKR